MWGDRGGWHYNLSNGWFTGCLGRFYKIIDGEEKEELEIC